MLHVVVIAGTAPMFDWCLIHQYTEKRIIRFYTFIRICPG